MTELFTKTDKNLIPTLPRYTFGGRIVVIQSEGEARRAVEYLRTFKILGIDTETRPSFKRGVQYQVALLQIAGDGICFLFRLNFMGFPPCLVKLLEDPTILKIGLSLHDDFRMLSHRCEGFHPAGYVDLQPLAAGMGIEDMSLQKLWANFFRQRISKSAQLSNWEADHLDEKQRVYAATDADTVIHLYRRMTELHLSGDYTLLPPPAPVQPQQAEQPSTSNSTPSPTNSTSECTPSSSNTENPIASAASTPGSSAEPSTKSLKTKRKTSKKATSSASSTASAPKKARAKKNSSPSATIKSAVSPSASSRSRRKKSTETSGSDASTKPSSSAND